MLQTLDDMFAARAAATPPRDWTTIPGFLKAQTSGPARLPAKTRCALNGLLRAKKISVENTELNLDWFDKSFPLEGYEIRMRIKEATYHDYRHRARAVIVRMLGGDATKAALRTTKDGWTDVIAALEKMDLFSDVQGPKRLIPIRDTLTDAARRAGVQPAGLSQDTLLELYNGARKSERVSLRKASKLIAKLQGSGSDVAVRWFRHPITPIEAKESFQYNVPKQLKEEVDRFVKNASRRKEIRAKGIHEYVASTTCTGYRTTIHAVIDALLAKGRLDPQAVAFVSALKDPNALRDVVGHMARRVETGEIKPRHATTLIWRLPGIMKRNDIDPTHLRGLITEVRELNEHPDDAEMPEHIKDLCRELIERQALRNRFLLAHARPRRVAQDILATAKAESRQLTPSERAEVIRHGVVALFCAIEIGGAPVRVENVLRMPYGTQNAWLRTKGKGFEVVIPSARVKNKKEIRFVMPPDKHKFCDTVRWYLKEIRPLILKGPKTKTTRASQWLIPMRGDVSRPCPYATFHAWFTKIMRDVVEVPCTPHNFRHGQASLLYHRYPEHITKIAIRLGDQEATVLRHYAWVHDELAMAEGQRLVVELIEN